MSSAVPAANARPQILPPNGHSWNEFLKEDDSLPRGPRPMSFASGFGASSRPPILPSPSAHHFPPGSLPPQSHLNLAPLHFSDHHRRYSPPPFPSLPPLDAQHSSQWSPLPAEDWLDARTPNLSSQGAFQQTSVAPMTSAARPPPASSSHIQKAGPPPMAPPSYSHHHELPLRDHRNADIPSQPPKSRPKPQPLYGKPMLPEDENELQDENDLPEANLEAIMGSNKRKMVGGGGSGKSVKRSRAGEASGRGGAKAGGGRGGAAGGGAVKPKRVRKRKDEESESEDDAAQKRGGRRAGASNWWPDDFTAMLDLVEDLLPAGKKEWERLYNQFAKWAAENGRPVRSCNTVEQRFKALVRTTKPTGSAECPPEIERAHELEHLISNRVASGTVRDDDLDDEVIEISSDDKPAAKKTYIAKHVKVEPGTEGRGRASTAQLRGTLQTVARAFEPEVQAARDDSRQARHVETLHLQHLTTQLRDQETENRRVRAELYEIQRQLDRESRRADNAERDLRLYEMLHARSGRRETSWDSPPQRHLSSRHPRRHHSPTPTTSRRGSSSQAKNSPQSPKLPIQTRPESLRLPPLRMSAFGGSPLRAASPHNDVDTQSDRISWPPTPGRA